MAVVMLHSRFMPAGWIGVQMFFVLSGFLITGILQRQREWSFGSYIWRFYWRRSLRIWPLYFFYCLVGIVGYLIFREKAHTPEHWVPVLTYTYNFQYLRPQFVASPYFGHFWSLCVEEQFYLVWPFLLFFLRTASFRWLAVGIVLAGPVVRLVTALLLQQICGEPAYVAKTLYSLPFSHLDAFACGASLALLPEAVHEKLAQNSRRLFFGLAAITLALGLVQCLMQRSRHLQPQWLALGYAMGLPDLRQYLWGYTVVNLTSAALILCLLQRTLLPRFFEHPIVTYLGKISYGIYVWHQGLLHIIFLMVWPCDIHSPQAVLRFLVILGSSVALASATYYGFERFFLELKYKTPELRRPVSIVS